MGAPLEICSKRSVVAVLASGVVISLTALTGGIAPAFAKPDTDTVVTTTVPAPEPKVAAPEATEAPSQEAPPKAPVTLPAAPSVESPPRTQQAVEPLAPPVTQSTAAPVVTPASPTTAVNPPATKVDSPAPRVVAPPTSEAPAATTTAQSPVTQAPSAPSSPTATSASATASVGSVPPSAALVAPSSAANDVPPASSAATRGWCGRCPGSREVTPPLLSKPSISSHCPLRPCQCWPAAWGSLRT